MRVPRQGEFSDIRLVCGDGQHPPNFGDYIGAVTVGGTTFAVWADSRKTISINGVPRNVVDVFFASVG